VSHPRDIRFFSDFTLGVEEELFLVDPESFALAPVAADVLGRIDAPADAVAHEAFAAEIELRSPPLHHAGEAAAVLASLRAAARAAGATPMGCGLHPAAPYGEAELVDAERYRRVEQDVRSLIRRAAECALHVHVGMPDAETAIRVFNGLRRWLPLMEGLAAASPFWFGVDSGMASARAAIVRAYPSRGVPRAFRDLDDWAETAEASLAAGGLDDATRLWWDVRLQPRLGTVEVRELDAQASLEDAAALAALVHGLALLEADTGAPAAALPPTEAIAWSCFRAARDGLDAEILHDGRLTPIAEVARAAVSAAAPRLRERGAESALGGVERIVSTGGAAGWQRAAHARGGMKGLLAELVERTRP
jgi:carboxylate-amine ligase